MHDRSVTTWCRRGDIPPEGDDRHRAELWITRPAEASGAWSSPGHAPQPSVVLANRLDGPDTGRSGEVPPRLGRGWVQHLPCPEAVRAHSSGAPAGCRIVPGHRTSMAPIRASTIGSDRTLGPNTPRWPRGEARYEEDVPTKRTKAGQEARVPRSHAHPWWPGRPGHPSPEGTAASRRLIHPVRGRSSFARLRHQGRRVRVGGVGITYESPPDPTTGPVRVAFAIGRSVGSAVVRNRLRRRLRHLLADCDAAHLPAGTYLFRLAPSTADLTYQELSDTVMRALERLRVER